MNTSIIAVHNLSHIYRRYEKQTGFLNTVKQFFKRPTITVEALKNASFQIAPGEIIGLLGPNGAGKTTLLKILSGLIHPSSGTATVLNTIPHKKEPLFLQQIGMVMGQKSQLLWDIPPIDTLHIIQELYKIPTKLFHIRLAEFIDLLSLQHLLHTPVRNLSLGERMKFELICSLIHHPKLLFLDEPTIGLDITSQRNIRNFLKEMNHLYQTTMIITSHYMRDIEVLAKRVLIIKKGSILQDTPTHNLLKDFGDLQKITFTSTEQKIYLPFPFEKIAPQEYTISCPPNNLQQTLQTIVQHVAITGIQTHTASLEDALFSLFKEQE